MLQWHVGAVKTLTSQRFLPAIGGPHDGSLFLLIITKMKQICFMSLSRPDDVKT